MEDNRMAERKEALRKAMTEERGNLQAHIAFMVEKDPDFIEAMNNLYTRSLSDETTLPIKTREFIAMAILAHRGLVDAVCEHGKRALRHGATKEELLAAIEATIIPGGAPTFAAGVRALMKIEEDEKKAAVK